MKLAVSDALGYPEKFKNALFIEIHLNIEYALGVVLESFKY